MPPSAAAACHNESSGDDLDDSYGSGASDSEESVARPTFVPKAQRLTVREDQQRQSEDLLKDEKRSLENELRKNRTRAEVAESIRRATEKDESNDLNGYDSERGMPDCSDDKLDTQLEVPA
jgi:hypothetical protein